MKRANILESKLVALFRSGADEEHTADEMQELLEGIDFQTLLQAVYSMRETVYEYRVDSDMEKGFVYRGPELFPGKAVLLYTDDGYGCYDVALHEQAYELWLLPDATFVVVSRIRSAIGNDASVVGLSVVGKPDNGKSVNGKPVAGKSNAIKYKPTLFMQI